MTKDDVALPEYRYVKEHDEDAGALQGDRIVGVWWNTSPMDARRELLDQSGIVDIATDNLLELADTFDMLVTCKWYDLPPIFRHALIKIARVELKDGK